MAKENSSFKETVSALFEGMEEFITSKTVVGEPMKMEDGTIVIPFVEASFGIGAGASDSSTKRSSGSGGMGGKIAPSAVLVLKDGASKLVNVKYQDSLTKVMDLVPDVVNRISNMGSKKQADMSNSGDEVIREMKAETAEKPE
ncbi:MAG: sporulation protein [Lachnospiraceae bacterium]|nr:sporulation protein [Lachnospiraceae bacterium]MBQ9563292.1 sporulation protein [Lachnospiraceae bacterium]MBR0152993.1 sporulation protein [Lachnospiraceae bacterium]